MKANERKWKSPIAHRDEWNRVYTIASEQLNNAFIIKIQKGISNLGDRKVNEKLDVAPPIGN